MTECLLRAKILFFDSNPFGRIITRFSKDQAVLDNVIPNMCSFITIGLFRSLAVSISIAIVNPYILVVIFIAIIFMLLVLRKGS